MASGHHTIPAFPDDVDRDIFGHWLSGFVDGEGCFDLAVSRRWGAARLSIGLRSDDGEILHQIRAFWRCGTIILDPRIGKPGHPKLSLQIGRTEHLAAIIVPHFDAYPLRAKKRRDFAIWKEAVGLLRRIMLRKRRRRPIGYGQLPKWTDAEHAEFRSLRDALKAIRHFDSSPQGTIVTPRACDRQPTFWD